MKPIAFTLLAVLLSGVTSHATVTFDWATVGDAGNAADTTGYGAVGYEYNIATTEVNLTQRSRTANVATLTTSSAHTLSVGDQVTLSSVASGFDGTFAVTATTFSYASTGSNVGATASTGSLTGASATHVADADFWVPAEDEWYKAAYYQPVGAGGPSDSYWLYPTASDSVPAGNTIGVADSGNFNDGDYAKDQNGLPTYLTDGGAYGINSASYYGTFDQGGNVWEWNEALVTGSSRGLRGGSWLDNENALRSSFRNFDSPSFESVNLGFRVSSVPEPSTGMLIILGGAALLAGKRRRATL